MKLELEEKFAIDLSGVTISKSVGGLSFYSCSADHINISYPLLIIEMIHLYNFYFFTFVWFFPFATILSLWSLLIVITTQLSIYHTLGHELAHAVQQRYGLLNEMPVMEKECMCEAIADEMKSMPRYAQVANQLSNNISPFYHLRLKEGIKKWRKVIRKI